MLAAVAFLMTNCYRPVDVDLKDSRAKLTEERLADHRFVLDEEGHKEAVTFYSYDHSVGFLKQKPGTDLYECYYGTWEIKDGEIVVSCKMHVDDIFMLDTQTHARLYVRYRYEKYYQQYLEDSTFDIANDFWFPWNEYDHNNPWN